MYFIVILKKLSPSESHLLLGKEEGPPCSHSPRAPPTASSGSWKESNLPMFTRPLRILGSQTKPWKGIPGDGFCLACGIDTGPPNQVQKQAGAKGPQEPRWPSDQEACSEAFGALGFLWWGSSLAEARIQWRGEDLGEGSGQGNVKRKGPEAGTLASWLEPRCRRPGGRRPLGPWRTRELIPMLCRDPGLWRVHKGGGYTEVEE